MFFKDLFTKNKKKFHKSFIEKKKNLSIQIPQVLLENVLDLKFFYFHNLSFQYGLKNVLKT